MWATINYTVLYMRCALLINPGVIEALHSGCYITHPRSSRLEGFVKRDL